MEDVNTITEKILELCRKIDKSNNENNKNLLLSELEKLCSLSIKMRTKHEN